MHGHHCLPWHTFNAELITVFKDPPFLILGYEQINGAQRANNVASNGRDISELTWREDVVNGNNIFSQNTVGV
ncbi:hypothetical protein D9M69_406490 [compost metagenome]